MRTTSIDTEFGWVGGDECESAFVPVLFSAMCVETGERWSFWGRDPGLAQFLSEHSDDLFVSHNMIAEAKYLLRLGIAPPRRWFDTLLAWRYVSNAEVVPRFGLLDALVKLGIPYAFREEKEQLAKRIGNLQFDPSSPDERRRIRKYCLEDCVAAAGIYRQLVTKVPPCWMSHATEFCLALARMELRGIGIDMATYYDILERRVEIVERVTEDVNATHKVFTGGTLSRKRFFNWCARNGIGWPQSLSPRTGKKLLSLEGRVLERMCVRHPFIQQVYEANRTARRLLKRSMVVDGRTGRHYFGNIPFAMATGRTSFLGFLLSGPKWTRLLAVPRSPDHVLVSVDLVAEEILIAAWLSGDSAMLAGYVSGDPHMALAIAAGAAPPGATKDTHPAIRKKYKVVNHAANYGQSAYGMAESTGMHFQEARALVAQHRRVFADYYRWSDRYTTKGFRLGRCETAKGWPRKVARTDNPRSVANYPVQGSGSDLMRVATIALSAYGLQLLATNHDGFLLECIRNELPRLREAVDAALSMAVNQVLPGAPMRWTTDVFENRYRDPDGEEVWGRVQGILRSSSRALVSAS
jgi:DNA polymerase I-like protein with 3'-5' exonuclease and polymerase domains